MKGLYISAMSDLLTPEYTPACMNVRFRFGNVQRAPGRSLKMQTLSTQSFMDFATFTNVTGAKTMVALTASTLSDNAFTGYDEPNFRFAGAVTMAQPSTANVRFSWTQGEERLFACRASVPVALKQPTPGTWAVEQLTNAPTAYFLEYFNNRVIAMRLKVPTPDAVPPQTSVVAASQIRWTKQGDYKDWLTTTGHGGFLELYDNSVDPITGGKVLNDRLTVYRKNSITDLVVTGVDTAPFLPQQRANGMGCAFPWTLASAGQFHIFVSNDFNVYMWDGSKLNPIGTPIHSLVRQLINVDKDLPDTTDWRSIPFATMFMAFKEYHLVIPQSNGDVHVLVYDYLRDSWTRDMIPGLTALYEWPQKVSANASRVFDILAYPTIFPTLAAGCGKDYHIIDERIVGDYLTPGSTGGMEMYFDSPDMYYGKEGVTNGTLERIVVAQATPYYLNEVPYEVKVSTDRGGSFGSTFVVTPQMAHQGFEFADFNVTSNVRRYRFRYPGGGTAARPSWRGYTDLFIPSGEFFPREGDIDAPYGIWDETLWDLCLWG
jgi:hypothetical protein